MYLADGGPFWFAVFLLIGAAGGLLFYLVAFILAPRARSPIKEETFESGQIPPGGKRVRLVMQYFSFLLLFLIFDVVSMFLYVWGASYLNFSPSQSVYALILLLLLLPPIYLTLKVAKSVGV
ncbi:MAG: NADH-quinone oxidoreductase subunit A [Conexivisphaerales archaeon]